MRLLAQIVHPAMLPTDSHPAPQPHHSTLNQPPMRSRSASHSAPARRALVAALTLPLILVGCGDATGPGVDVDFPAIAPADLAQYCIRGQAVPPVTRSGSVTVTDCQGGGDPFYGQSGYYDAFHVRVANTAAVTFTVDSDFDSWLDLLLVGDVSDIASTLTLLDSDDDTAPGLDAEITHVLSPDTDYFLRVSGLDDTETGSYTVRMDY